MARQRFIWPSIWSDPDLASLTEGAMLLYIACFSLADDEGRLDGNPVFLRAQAFPYRKVSTTTVSRWRSAIASACSNFHVYEHEGREYVQFLNWREFQKPKYPSPSKLPPPPCLTENSGNGSRNDSGNDSGRSSRNDSPTGRDGLGSTPLPPTQETTPPDAPTRRRRRRTTTPDVAPSDPMGTLPIACDYCTLRFPSTPASKEHTLHVHRHRLDPDTIRELETVVFGDDT